MYLANIMVYKYISGIFIGICAWLFWEISQLDYSVPKEFFYQTDDFINHFGYRAERYVVESEDGALSTIFRILPPVGNVSRKPVILFGGIFCSSDVFVTQGPKRDLGKSLLCYLEPFFLKKKACAHGAFTHKTEGIIDINVSVSDASC